MKSEYEALCPPGLEIWGSGRGSKESVTGGSLPKTICSSPTLSLSSWTACIPPPRWRSRPSRSSWPPPREPPCSRAGRGSSRRRSGRGSGSGGHVKQDKIELQSCRTSCQTLTHSVLFVNPAHSNPIYIFVVLLGRVVCAALKQKPRRRRRAVEAAEAASTRNGTEFHFQMSVLSSQIFTDGCLKTSWCNTMVNTLLSQFLQNMLRTSNIQILYILTSVCHH